MVSTISPGILAVTEGDLAVDCSFFPFLGAFLFLGVNTIN